MFSICRQIFFVQIFCCCCFFFWIKLPAINPIHRDDMYLPPYPSRNMDHEHNGSNCHNDDCTWPNRFVWHDDPLPHTTIYVSDWFASPEWAHTGQFQRYPTALTMTRHCYNTERFYRCVPNWCPHKTPYIPDLKYRFLFWKESKKKNI